MRFANPPRSSRRQILAAVHRCAPGRSSRTCRPRPRRSTNRWCRPSLYNNGPLATLPGDGFLVPVRVTDPTRAFTCRVFVDFDPGPTNTGATAAFACPTPTLPALDGGATLIPFFLGPTDLGDPTACHTITFVVTYSFSGMSNHSSGDTLGSHSVVWNYVPANGCYQYDAGDGARLLQECVGRHAAHSFGRALRRAAGKRGAVAALAVGLCVAASCDPIAPPAGRLAPINACPAHPCEAYDQFGPAPSCVNGVCTVTPAPTKTSCSSRHSPKTRTWLRGERTSRP